MTAPTSTVASNETTSARIVPALYRRHQFIGVLVAMGAIALIGPGATNSFRTDYALDLWLGYSIAAVGFYLMFALAGRFAFCQTFMMALGGYTCAWVTETYGAGAFIPGALAAMALTAIIAIGVGWCARRVVGFMFAIVTLALDEVGRTLFRQAESFTGLNGTKVGIAAPEIFGYEFLGADKMFWVLLGGLTLTMLIAAAIERSPVRRDALAGSVNDLVARTVGAPLTRTQIALFALGSALGGLSGAMFATWNGSVAADSFNLEIAVALLMMVVLGGVASPWGAVLGAAFYVAIPEVLTSVEKYQTIVFGTILLVVVIASPEGLLGLAQKGVNAIRSRVRRSEATP